MLRRLERDLPELPSVDRIIYSITHEYMCLDRFLKNTLVYRYVHKLQPGSTDNVVLGLVAF